MEFATEHSEIKAKCLQKMFIQKTAKFSYMGK